jgi:hypothetical protein
MVDICSASALSASELTHQNWISQKILIEETKKQSKTCADMAGANKPGVFFAGRAVTAW